MLKKNSQVYYNSTITVPGTIRIDNEIIDTRTARKMYGVHSLELDLLELEPLPFPVELPEVWNSLWKCTYLVGAGWGQMDGSILTLGAKLMVGAAVGLGGMSNSGQLLPCSSTYETTSNKYLDDDDDTPPDTPPLKVPSFLINLPLRPQEVS